VMVKDVYRAGSPCHGAGAPFAWKIMGL
jgi:hypothetical protein